MKLQNLIGERFKEKPSDASIISQIFLIRGGYIKYVANGIYSLTMPAKRIITKIENIVREEMDKIDGQEVLMPVVLPKELWSESGRFDTVGNELLRIKDRSGRDMLLAMTHEEAVTDVARDEIDSYKRLPLLVFQLQTKWRDDPRPRAGLIRVREFTMKDSYSFDIDQAGLEKVYKAHYDAYFRIFKRAGLPVIAVGSDSGMMGGKVSHEYMYLSDLGEDTIINCPKCGYTANRQVAVSKKEYFKEAEKPMKLIETPNTKTIEELTNFLNIPATKTAKALFTVGTFIDDKTGEETEKMVVGLIRGDMDIEESKLLNVAKANSLRPAHEEEIVEAGMVPGFGSPIGCKDFKNQAVVIVVDDSVAKSNNLVAGANKTGFHFLNTNFSRDYDGIVADIASVAEGYSCPECGEPLNCSKGIEVGNIFQLGQRYSEAMNCYYQDENGVRKPVVMGSYGIGIGRLLACLAEEYNDDQGLKLPLAISPYQIHLISLIKDTKIADEIYHKLVHAGYDVLYDDRKGSAGVKFSDADLIGLPLRLTLGNRSLKSGQIEAKLRKDLTKTFDIDLGNMINEIKNLLEEA